MTDSIIRFLQKHGWKAALAIILIAGILGTLVSQDFFENIKIKSWDDFVKIPEENITTFYLTDFNDFRSVDNEDPEDIKAFCEYMRGFELSFSGEHNKKAILPFVITGGGNVAGDTGNSGDYWSFDLLVSEDLKSISLNDMEYKLDREIDAEKLLSFFEG